MPLLTIAIPTRDRARYLGASLRSVLQRDEVPIEVLVLDNASSDDTRAVASEVADSRVRYVRSETRLSMRDNFERGLDLARGDYIGFIGDDDGLLARAPERIFQLFENPDIMAIAAARAHYFWPDLLSSRRNTGLLPRGEGVTLRNSRTELRTLLDDSDYYRLPCLYHGFVRRELVDRARVGRFFHSSQVDIYSAIAFSMEDITFALSHAPLVINGGSARSNGASHFGGGTEEEKARFKQEDDLGFLPGFEPHATVGSLIVESALRYAELTGISLADIFPREAVVGAMARERAARMRLRMSCETLAEAEAAAGSPVGAIEKEGGRLKRLARLTRSFIRTMPVDLGRHDSFDVLSAAKVYDDLLAHGRTRITDNAGEQLSVSWRIARN